MSQVTRTMRWGVILTLLSGVNGCVARQQAADTWEPDARQRAILDSLPIDVQAQRDELIRLARLPLPSHAERLRILNLTGSDFPRQHPLRRNEAALLDFYRDQGKPSAAELSELQSAVNARLIALKGGRFIMGDFGPMKFKDGLTITGQTNNPAHTVELSAYAIMKGPVTFDAFDLYLRSQGRSVLSWIGEAYEQAPIVGALAHRPGYVAWPVNWRDADGYCRWLKDLTGQPFALPTEAQWEYAAREGGKFISHPMHHLPGIQWGNPFVPTSESADQEIAAVKKLAGEPTVFIRPHPPDLTGENRIGMQGVVGGDEVEWTGDWYADDPRFGQKLLKDPTGAKTGSLKSVRAVAGNWANSVLHRYGHEVTQGNRFRCVLSGDALALGMVLPVRSPKKHATSMGGQT